MAWQQRLFDQIVQGHLTDAIDLPTGLGKTSVMAIWLIARALAEPGVSFPRRLVYVVDRRVVVDQATAEADNIAAALRPAQDDPLVQEFRKRLGLQPEQELPVSTLRGGRADDREWTCDPAAPAIIICTVDMAGSRLLFSGYRLSRWSRSMQAGLMGVDSLIVLDEAHISPAFDRAVRRVRDLGAETSAAAVPLMRFLPLSATLAEAGAIDTFRLEASDYDDPLVARRTGRSQPTKHIAFEALPGTKGALVNALAAGAAAFDGEERAVLVFCHSREVANATADALRKRLATARGTKDRGEEEDVALITGARRGARRASRKADISRLRLRGWRPRPAPRRSHALPGLHRGRRGRRGPRRRCCGNGPCAVGAHGPAPRPGEPARRARHVGGGDDLFLGLRGIRVGDFSGDCRRSLCST